MRFNTRNVRYFDAVCGYSCTKCILWNMKYISRGTDRVKAKQLACDLGGNNYVCRFQQETQVT